MSAINENLNDDQPVKTYKLAVYGTLKKNHQREGALSRSKYLGESFLKGCLVHLGHYPALVTEAGPQREDIPCEVYEIDAATLRCIDGIEGHPALYTRIEVDLPDYGKTFTYMYSASHFPVRRMSTVRVIEKGGWIGQQSQTTAYKVDVQRDVAAQKDKVHIINFPVATLPTPKQEKWSQALYPSIEEA